MALKYKEGDKVRIKSIDWYNKNKSKSHGTVACGGKYFDYDMREWCGKTMTILTAYQTCYIMQEDGAKDLWTDEMIEGLVEEEIKSEPKFKVGDKVITNKGHVGNFEGWVSDYQVRVLFEKSGDNVVIHPKILKLVEEETKPKYEDEMNGEYYSTPKYLVRPNGYRFVDENGNEILTSKIILKKEYPKTYEECCKVMDCAVHPYITADEPGIISYYEDDLNSKVLSLRKLLICRDAYWKIAGEEMGLGKPWEPDYDSGVDKHGIIVYNGSIDRCGATAHWERHLNKVLEFPTREMRDAFYENFKEEIEICKELL